MLRPCLPVDSSFPCSHVLGCISPIFSPFFPIFCAFSTSRRGGSNEPQAGTQGQETDDKTPRAPFDPGPERLCDESPAGPRVALRQERSQVEEVLEGGRDARVLPPAMAVVRAFENNRKLARLRSNRESSSVLLRRVGRACRLLDHGALLDPGRDGEGCRAHAAEIVICF